MSALMPVVLAVGGIVLLLSLTWVYTAVAVVLSVIFHAITLTYRGLRRLLGKTA